MKDFESHVEAQSRHVREADKPKKRKQKKKKSKFSTNRKKGGRKPKKTGNGRRGKRMKLRTTSTCSNISCLNTLVKVLRLSKDNVPNFFAQYNRMNKRLTTLSSKKNKSSNMNASLDHLAVALGGNQSLRNNTPVCKGRYNSSEAEKVVG